MNANDFILGGIYKMKVGSRSHVKVPYYVEVVDIGGDYITTNIPKHHSLTISRKNGNWEYQTERMQYVGNSDKHRALLFNQENLV